MEAQLIKNFCRTMETKYLDKLGEKSIRNFINICYLSLSQKNGDQKIAVKVLMYYSEIIISDNYIVYKGRDNLIGYDRFIRTGVITIPIIDYQDIEKHREHFIKTLREFPEYNRDPNNPDLDITGNQLAYVLGGFAALGNPASFHNMFVRKLRLKAKQKVTDLFRQVIHTQFNANKRENSKLEMLVDRMMYRNKSQAPSAESWHRDVIPANMLENGDEVYGGWINLDTVDQRFSCVLGSHLGIDQKTLAQGFATVPKHLIKNLNKEKTSIIVPPGHIVIFPQYIIHEVVSTKAKYDMMRLFTGWRITTSDEYLHKNMDKLFDTQSVIPLPSSQLPPMYASNHSSFFLRKQFKPISRLDHKVNLIEWSKNTMKPKTLVEKNDYVVASRFMHSLEQYQFNMYPHYTDLEKNEYKPSRI